MLLNEQSDIKKSFLKTITARNKAKKFIPWCLVINKNVIKVDSCLIKTLRLKAGLPIEKIAEKNVDHIFQLLTYRKTGKSYGQFYLKSSLKSVTSTIDNYTKDGGPDVV